MKRPDCLIAQIYVDSDTPNMSVLPGEHGVAVLQDIMPWIKLTDNVETVVFDSDGDIDGNDFEWPKLTGDLNIILTKKQIFGSASLLKDSSMNIESFTGNARYIGLTNKSDRAGSRRVSLVDTSAIASPANTVAHELGHQLGVGPRYYRGHCIAEGCVMNAILPAKSRLQRTFCDREADLLKENATRLIAYKAGRLAVRPHSKIFTPSLYM